MPSVELQLVWCLQLLASAHLLHSYSSLWILLSIARAHEVLNRVHYSCSYSVLWMNSNCCQVCFLEHFLLRAGSRVIRIDPLRCLAGCRTSTRQLNQAKPVLCYIVFSYFISVILYAVFSTVRFCCCIMYFFFISLKLSVLSQEIG